MKPHLQGTLPYISAARAEAMVSIGGAVELGQPPHGRPAWTHRHRPRYGRGTTPLERFASALLSSCPQHSKPIHFWKALIESFPMMYAYGVAVFR